ncbi:hypothetical protein Vretimale_2056 [Volvox reticuliferus]|uniref:Uncharacterized protein n=1 Tax=Volvox reticuliferus TaxID=1737510 RepID=A0A8J4C471_9CHLO|nr:hypothetical protein Vretifemale_4389 [Volvox reticuliferus]GIL96269.1 hypothetical protein Vretimale_2056 [Volvox reticuliferus]
MQSALPVKADGALSPPTYNESVQHSPDCVSIVASQARASSSGCTSLLCTEDSLDECGMEDGCVLGDEVHELCISYRIDAGRRLHMAQLHHETGISCIKDVIRDDFCKQFGLRHDSTAGRSMDGSYKRRGNGKPGVQCHLPGAYRARMVVWMREVAEVLGLQWATVFTATSALDRFVAAAEALPPSNMLQLLVLACMSVAVKYEEVQQLSPTVWLSLAVDEAGRELYGPCDLQRCEFTLLQTIDWQLHEPNTFTFLEHFLAVTTSPAMPNRPNAEAAEAMLAQALSLVEVARMFSIFLSYHHSTVALACLTLAERLTYGDSVPSGSQEEDVTSSPLSAVGSAALSAALVATDAADAGASGSLSCGAIMGTTAGSSSAAAVAAVSGLPLACLAPKLSTCTEVLERCYEELLVAWEQQQQRQRRED